MSPNQKKGEKLMNILTVIMKLENLASFLENSERKITSPMDAELTPYLFDAVDIICNIDNAMTREFFHTMLKDITDTINNGACPYEAFLEGRKNMQYFVRESDLM